MPPPPPLSPDFVAAASEAKLRSLITEAATSQADVAIYLPPRADVKLDSYIYCSSDIKVTVASSGEGATLDGQEQTRLFTLGNGCSLTLRGLTLINGRGNSNGGVVYASNAGDVKIIDSTIRDCSAGEVRVELAAPLQRRTAAGRGREIERATAASPRSVLATAVRRRRLRARERCGLDNQLDR